MKLLHYQSWNLSFSMSSFICELRPAHLRAAHREGVPTASSAARACASVCGPWWRLWALRGWHLTFSFCICGCAELAAKLVTKAWHAWCSCCDTVLRTHRHTSGVSVVSEMKESLTSGQMSNTKTKETDGMSVNKGP